MREVCDLPDGPPNYAWCFDCVPEENSLLLEFADGARVEILSMNLVFRHPHELPGEPVYGRFGPAFPIRFDFLDTMGGGNLSYQVHPTTEYAREHFGLPFTQDESYYMLDVEPGAVVYLGCKDGTQPDEMSNTLRTAQSGGAPFDAGHFSGIFPAAKHDHFLIPAGTLHCSGSNSMVLEISATPYIFTFKLWDWNRLGLDGQPRPVNLDRGEKAVTWDRDETYASSLSDLALAFIRTSGYTPIWQPSSSTSITIPHCYFRPICGTGFPRATWFTSSWMRSMPST